MPRYNPAVVEPKWQKYWDEHRTFKTPDLPAGPKLYVLDMFPYPSGEGLHVGHPEGYTATDIVCRYQRMQGKSVLHPMGFDAFGLPAEEHAIRTNTPPRLSTERNIATFRRQLKMLGFSYDWDRELATTDVEYFRWTQWIFLLLFDTWFDPQQQRGRPIAELPIPQHIQAQGDDAVADYRDQHRLAYQAEAPVNWCPALGTVLANEEVVDGKSERGGHPVVRLPLRQWMLRITAYADRLLDDLESLHWSEGIKALQRNWIGRSTGAEVDFFIGPPDSQHGGPPDSAAFQQWKQGRAAEGFPQRPGDEVLRVYTTRPDTLYGATYMVISPEHPFVPRLTTAEHRAAVEQYCDEARRKSDLDRTDLAKEKTGVFTGSCAVNPVNGRSVPIWVADYVLMGYGTGAIMAVPAHDDRDFAFAVQFNLPVVAVVEPPADAPVDRAALLEGRTCFAGEGRAIHSGPYDHLPTADFKQRITADLAAAGLARPAVNYKLRDWLFSRQRFWGEPFPILHEVDEQGNPTGRVRPVPADQLPVDLPPLEDFKPHGRPEPPLEKAPHSWLYVPLDGKTYKRETNTMPQWAGSCWYYLRFIDPRNDRSLVDPAKERAWMPVDLYVGGAEHAVLHLLYARFWHKVLYDRGIVSTPEPFQRLVNQGMILGEYEFVGYQRRDQHGRHWVSAEDVQTARTDGQTQYVLKESGAPVEAVTLRADQVEKSEGRFVEIESRMPVTAVAFKMSKSRGNVINPDDIVRDYGADALRLYEMFMGPLEATKPWSMAGVNGVRSFLDRVWRMIVVEKAESMQLHPAVQDVPLQGEARRVVHKTIAAVTEDLENLAFNTAISRMMECTNFFTRAEVRPRQAMETLVLLLSPFAPHLCEELWQQLGHPQSLAYEPWPQYDPEAIRQDVVEIPVQILGKLRARVQVAAGADAAAMEAAARADARIQSLLEGKQVVKVIAIPGRLINFVVK